MTIFQWINKNEILWRNTFVVWNQWGPQPAHGHEKIPVQGIECPFGIFKSGQGIIFLTNSESGEIRIEIAHGISEKTIKQIKYLPGEGIIGRVIQSGEQAVVPRISEEPLFWTKPTHEPLLTDKIILISAYRSKKTTEWWVLSVQTVPMKVKKSWTRRKAAFGCCYHGCPPCHQYWNRPGRKRTIKNWKYPVKVWTWKQVQFYQYYR